MLLKQDAPLRPARAPGAGLAREADAQVNSGLCASHCAWSAV